MKTLTLITLFLALTLFRSSAETTVDVQLLTCEDSQDGTMVFNISESKAAQQPIWKPDSPLQPPLSIAKACALAKASLRARKLDVGQWQISACTLHRLPAGRFPDRWYYAIDFYRDKSDGRVIPDARAKDWSQTTVVLMDGSIVEPTVESK
jgi:hypothetical protein